MDNIEKIKEIFFSTINEKSLDEIFNNTLFHLTICEGKFLTLES